MTLEICIVSLYITSIGSITNQNEIKKSIFFIKIDQTEVTWYNTLQIVDSFLLCFNMQRQWLYTNSAPSFDKWVHLNEASFI